MAAAAAPWIHRAAMSAVAVGAAPQPPEANAKTAMPMARAFFAPMRSDTVPAQSSSAANRSV